VKLLFLLFFISSLLTACATRTEPKAIELNTTVEESTASSTIESNSGITLLPAPIELMIQPIIACETYSKLDTDGQKKQWVETQQILAKNKQDLLHRIKHACMYALPSSYMKDALKAHVLLQSLREDDTLASPEKAFINHLYMFNNENIKQMQRMRDDVRTIDILNQKYETLEKKYDASEQKLMQLKNIEKKLNVR
jgi:hypothetical protein